MAEVVEGRGWPRRLAPPAPLARPARAPVILPRSAASWPGLRSRKGASSSATTVPPRDWMYRPICAAPAGERPAPRRRQPAVPAQLQPQPPRSALRAPQAHPARASQRSERQRRRQHSQRTACQRRLSYSSFGSPSPNTQLRGRESWEGWWVRAVGQADGEGRRQSSSQLVAAAVSSPCQAGRQPTQLTVQPVFQPHLKMASRKFMPCPSDRSRARRSRRWR